MELKLKARVVKNRLKKYNVQALSDGKWYPIGQTVANEFYKLLEFNTEHEAVQHILGDTRLALVGGTNEK